MKKYTYLVTLCFTAVVLMTGCSTNEISSNTSINAYSLVTPPEHQLTSKNYLAENIGVSRADKTHPDAETPGYSTRVFYSSKESGGGDDKCSIKDRFDRKGVLAYYSADRTKRLSFHTGSFDEAMFRYSFKLSKKLDRKDRKKINCLYNSRVQGILGSVYNEFNLREGDNALDEAFDEIEERGLDFWH